MNFYKKIYAKFPSTYNLLRKLYHSTFIYKKNKNKQEQENLLKIEYRNKKNNELMQDVFNNQYIVHYGPFKSMKYIENSSGSQLLPKILGSYEQPIQNWFYDAISKQYENIIDIGCAEGYYAVGMAFKSNNSKIFAFDTDENARSLCKKLAELNNVSNQFVISSTCTPKDLNSIIINKTLIICDIEGNEFDLIDPGKVNSLINADMIIESHDYLHGYCNITEKLIERFSSTHIIEIIVDYKRDLSKYDYLKNINKEISEDITNERRGRRSMKWLRLRSLNQVD